MKTGDKRIYQALAMAGTALVLGLSMGYYAGRTEWLAREDAPHVAEHDIVEEPVSAAERFELFSVNIFDCGHILERREERAVTGPEAERVMEEMGGYTYEFKDGRMAVYREFQCCCPEHYYTGTEGGKAAVYRTDSDTFERSVICILELEKGSPAYDEMGRGMVFDSLEEVNLYLEGLDE